MAEMTEREFKKATGAAGYYAREVQTLTEEIAKQEDKAARADADAQAARDAAAAAREALDAMRSVAVDAARAIEDVTIVSDGTSTAGPSAGAKALDAMIVTDGDVSALDAVLPEGA